MFTQTPIIMKNLRLFHIFLFLVFSLQLSFSQHISINNSQVDFEINTMLIKNVKGTFQFIEGEIQLPLDELNEASIRACLDAQSINTKNKERDNHLRNEDFLDVDAYPTICFESTQISKTNTGYLAKGELTLHGITHAIEIPFTFSNHTFNGQFKLTRLDYEVGPSGGFLVGKEIKIKIFATIK